MINHGCMDAPVIIHVGQPKTGTTSVQRFLAGMNGSREAQELAYPLRDSSDINHNSSVIDLFFVERFRPLAFTTLLEPVWSWQRTRIGGAWSWLVDAVRASKLPTVVSSELLALAPDATAQEVLRSFQSSPMVVLIGTRAVSGLIPSWFQQVGKEYPVPTFEQFTRSVLMELLGSPAKSASGWMSSRHLRQTWLSAGKHVRGFSVEIVQTSLERPTAVLDAIGLVAGHLDLPNSGAALVSPSNAAWSYDVVELWRQHQHRFISSPPGARHKTLAAMLRGQFGFPTPSLARHAIDPEAVSLIDATFPADASRGSDTAAVSLRNRLNSTEPITLQPTVDQKARLIYESAEILKAMSTYQRRMDAFYPAWRLYRRIRDLTRCS